MRHAAFLPLLLVSACVQPQPTAAPASAGPAQPALASCPVSESSDWHAWINAMPGPNATPTLIVTGKAVVSSGGYSVGWGDPLVMESYPVQVSVELRPVRASEMHTQALVTKEVRGEWPMREPVGSVTITCGPKTLARISPVESAR
ncbi:MAG: hypothetical protein ABIQ32_11890 [Sphingomicrobium sp.]